MMQNKDLDYLVLLHDGFHVFTEPNPVFATVGLKSIGETMVLCRNDGTISLYVARCDRHRAAELDTSLQVESYDNIEDSCEALKSEISKSTSTTIRTGIVGLSKVKRALAVPMINALKNVNMMSVDDEFYRIFRVKSSREIENARKATEIAEQGYGKMLEVTRSGVYEYVLSSEADSHMKTLGAEDDFLLLCSSQHNRLVHPPLRRVLASGDIILTEISPCYGGQFVQICRTVVIGPLRDELLEKYALLTNSIDQGLRSAIPGATVSDVVQAMNSPLEKAGYEKYCRPPYMRVRGHGLGISSISPGDIGIENKTVLEENMMFVMHPNQYLPETGYMMCGEPIVITRKGGTPLTKRKPGIDSVTN